MKLRHPCEAPREEVEAPGEGIHLVQMAEDDMHARDHSGAIDAVEHLSGADLVDVHRVQP